MTDDDTFRRLIQSDYKDVNQAYMAWIHRGNINNGGDNIKEFLKPYGWTWHELMSRQIREITERNGFQ